MLSPIEQLTKQGYDMQFGTNVIGHYYFTTLLLPILERTAAETGYASRVVDVSSSAHGFSDKNHIINYETLRDGKARRVLSPNGLYAQSKSVRSRAAKPSVLLNLCCFRQGNIFVSQAHARKYAGRGITFTSLNPGMHHIKCRLQHEVSRCQQEIYTASFSDMRRKPIPSPSESL